MNNIIIHSKFTAHSTAISKAISNFETSGDTVLKGDRNTIKSLKIEGLYLNLKLRIFLMLLFTNTIGNQKHEDLMSMGRY